MLLQLLIISAFSIFWLGLAIFLRTKKKKSYAFLLFFTIFYLYFFKVLDYTLFQYQSLLLLKYFNPNLILNGSTAGKELNLIPLITLTTQDLQTSLLNILLFVPFGFGLPFITTHRMTKIIAIGALVSISIEVLQFLTGYLGQITFRVADINDLIFNTLGAAVGYVLFIVFTRCYSHLVPNSDTASNQIMQHLHEKTQRPQL